MTPHQRYLASIVGKLLLLAIGLGAAWGMLNATVAGKLDTTRFVADSINTSNALHEIKAGVDEANARLRELVCRNRPGCR